MRRNQLLMGIGMAILSCQVWALDPPSQASVHRRQLVACMTKQMSSSRTISYIEATKVCKELQKSQSSTLADNENPPPASTR